MKNTCVEVKKHAKYVTDDVNYDDIVKAFIHFGLIQKG